LASSARPMLSGWWRSTRLRNLLVRILSRVMSLTLLPLP
jgi:hypothetical protein